MVGFEDVLGVLDAERGETGGEPFGGFGLDRGEGGG